MDENPPAPSDEKASDKTLPSTPETRNSNGPAAHPPAPSLASRVQSSASSLLQNTFLNPRSPSFGHSLSSSLSQSLANSAKPSSSHGPVLSAGESSSHSAIDTLPPSASSQHNTASTRNPSASGNTSLHSEPFRSNRTSTTENHDNNREFWNQFESQLNIAPPFSSPEPPTGKGKDKSTTTPKDHFHSPPSPTTTTLESTWSSSQPTDGSAVISLLSSPSFDPLPPSSLPPSPTLAPISDTATTPYANPPSPLSLLPDIQSLLALPPEELSSVPTVAEWLDLDASYTDAVWGGALKTCTEEARREVQARREMGADYATGVYAGPAVRRLGMILAHLREKKAGVSM
ncbi:hypothetical protein PRK78_004786 [Emydomyces testavorans]|uniref:Uncharacterized protein n=1 Tax=Emydomyces testavorans TaxID=2070801 RepID=A0AAF0DKJ2_9EURO|nr:hypothetical protein PRK78_004786 [Emydomyces testavorans]